MRRAAVFLDRDGTVIRDVHYIGRPELVELVPDAADSIRTLNEAGLLTIVVTNQSGIARGYFTVADYERVRSRVEEMLAERGARIDATYMCPHYPDVTGECECRKPRTLLFRQAAAEHDLDLGASFYVGDKLRDVIPAAELGGTGILVPGPETPAHDRKRAEEEYSVAVTLDEAVRRIIESRR